jgi:hypothetical protein
LDDADGLLVQRPIAPDSEPEFRPSVCSGITRNEFMPRYFFDLVDDKTVFDRKGVNLPNVVEARKFATTFAKELMEAKSKLLGESWSMWSVEVSNGKFERLFKVPFTDVEAGIDGPTTDTENPLEA